MTEQFQLSNSRGEIVGINNYDLMGNTPSGLGLTLNNTYNQYDNYFELSKTSVSQGKFQINILFGDVESLSYQTFSSFATFLSFEPLTMIYTTDIGEWKRDARLSGLTKTEIGGTTVFQTDKLNEQFTLDFINPWYNNKTGSYKNYGSDSNLSIFGKGFFNELGTANRNYIQNSSGESASQLVRPTVIGGVNEVGSVNSTITYNSDNIQLTYTGNGTQEWYYSLADAWSNLSDSVLDFDNTYTLSVYVKGTVTGAMFRVSDVFSTPIKINNNSWTRLTYTFKFPNLAGDHMSQFYIRLNASNGTDTNATGFATGQTLQFKQFKLEISDKATDWITAPEDGKTDKNMLYTYGYMGLNYNPDNTNQPLADKAETDKTYLDD